MPLLPFLGSYIRHGLPAAASNTAPGKFLGDHRAYTAGDVENNRFVEHITEQVESHSHGVSEVVVSAATRDVASQYGGGQGDFRVKHLGTMN